MGVIPLIIILLGTVIAFAVFLFIASKRTNSPSMKKALRVSGSIATIIALLIAGVVYWLVEFSRGLDSFGG